MPHDAYGRPVGVGDYVKTKPLNYSTVPVVGRVISIKASQRCSGQITWPAIGGNQTDYFDLDSSALVLRSDGSDPEPISGPQDPALIEAGGETATPSSV